MAQLAGREFLSKPVERIKGSGYCVQSLEAALWCFWHTTSFKDAVLKAANLGDDADTTAAICGQLAGAFYGVQQIPEEWIGTLAMGEEILGLSDRLFAERYASMDSGQATSADLR